MVSSKLGHLAHFVYGLSEAGYVFSEQEKDSLWYMPKLWLDRLEHTESQNDGIHELLARLYSQIGRFVASVDTDRGMQLFENAHRHTNLETISGLSRRARIYLLKNMLMCRNPELWKRALMYSLNFGEAIFETFYWFGHALLEFGDEDQSYQLLQTIHWADTVIAL